MKIEGAVIKEQGITFAILIVKSHVINNRMETDRIIQQAESCIFPGLPVVLMAQDSSGRPTYYGRSDICKFMASVPVNAVPWKRYALN